MECGFRIIVSMFLKCTISRSPTSRWMSGPGIRSWSTTEVGEFRRGLFQPFVKRRKTTVGNTLSAGEKVSPVIPSPWFGIMFQVAGTAATQTCRVAASAGAEAAMASSVARTAT